MYAIVVVLLWKKVGKPLLAGLVALAIVSVIVLVAGEMHSFERQAAWLTDQARNLKFKVEPGPSATVRYPGDGPYDQRLGYNQLPQLVHRLTTQEDYAVTAQARMSPGLIQFMDKGLSPTYHEKDQAGLALRDCRGDAMFGARYPERVYDGFESVPPLLVDSLLFIEDRDLLDAERPRLNPALEWSRLGRAVIDQAIHVVDSSHPTPGGSTLATQIEKYRHSPEGRTGSMKEKLRQMASASLRVYLDGEETLPARRQIVLHYLNTVPLSARPGFGEINGLGDGLWAWYGRDFAEMNRLVKQAHRRPGLAQATAYKQALSLMIAQRRPSYYLDEGQQDLAELTNSYLRVMAEAGVISDTLRDAALPLPLKLQDKPPSEKMVPFVERKASTAMRGKLAGMLGISRAYDLDRFDLVADSTLDSGVQRTATELLRGLKDPAAAKAAGLYGFHLLKEGDDTSKLVFSFTLFERGEQANLLRVQTDNFDQPLDINEGARLDLGSTSKLRTLVTYLEYVADLHKRWSDLDDDDLAEVFVHGKDAIGRWARDYLLHAEDTSLEAMLEAAMQRTYSANPAEGFFTGGGLHHFENFEPEDNSRTLTVHDALQRSVNLVFIRLMRDLVYHVMYRSPDSAAVLLEDPDSSNRRDYLARFADKEGREYLGRFYKKYHGKSTQEAEDLLLLNVRPTLPRLATILFTLEPDAGDDRLAAFLKENLEGPQPSEAMLRSLHGKYAPGTLSLADRGFIVHVHPLELWLVGFLRQHPGATLTDTVAASRDERQDVYQWLFKTRHKSAQDVRIRDLLEIEAFLEIHRSWKRMGYPFESLTPSYAAALGASGDRPAALAEMMGIIVNRGLRLPVERIPKVEFARGTPYETKLEYRPPPPERVLPEEVADAVRAAILDVVNGGTAVRIKGALKRRDGSVVDIGGKTGTGDHRFDVFGRGGQLISSRVVNRTATFVFLIGDRYFGTMMAYVHEPYAANYKFTSALPVQLLKTLTPALLPLVEDQGVCSAPAVPTVPAAEAPSVAKVAAR